MILLHQIQEYLQHFIFDPSSISIREDFSPVQIPIFSISSDLLKLCIEIEVLAHIALFKTVAREKRGCLMLLVRIQTKCYYKLPSICYTHMHFSSPFNYYSCYYSSEILSEV